MLALPPRRHWFVDVNGFDPVGSGGKRLWYGFSKT